MANLIGTNPLSSTCVIKLFLIINVIDSRRKETKLGLYVSPIASSVNPEMLCIRKVLCYKCIVRVPSK